MRGLPGKRVVLRPLAVADARALRTIHALPEVVEWWGSPEDDFPLGDDPDATRFTIVCDGEIAGLIQYGEELDPNYRYAWIDIFVDPGRQRRGWAPTRSPRSSATSRPREPASEDVPATTTASKVGKRFGPMSMNSPVRSRA